VATIERRLPQGGGNGSTGVFDRDPEGELKVTPLTRRYRARVGTPEQPGRRRTVGHLLGGSKESRKGSRIGGHSHH